MFLPYIPEMPVKSIESENPPSGPMVPNKVRNKKDLMHCDKRENLSAPHDVGTGINCHRQRPLDCPYIELDDRNQKLFDMIDNRESVTSRSITKSQLKVQHKLYDLQNAMQEFDEAQNVGTITLSDIKFFQKTFEKLESSLITVRDDDHANPQVKWTDY